MTGLSWGAVRLLARTEWRSSARTLLALGVLAGLAAGLALGAAALARRTTSAPDRLAVATGLEDARVAFFGGAEVSDAVAALPVVRAAWRTENAVGQLDVPGQVAYVSIAYGAPPPPGLFTPVLVDGRAPDPAVAEEVLVTEQFAEAVGLRAGDVLGLRMLLPEEVYAFDVGFGEPDGPPLRLTVTGVGRTSQRGGGGFGPVFAGPAFAERYAALSAGPGLFLRLEPGPQARRELVAGLAGLESALPAEAAEFGPPTATFPDEDLDPQVAVAQRVLGGGLLLSALVAAAAGVLAVGQSLVRWALAGRAQQRTEAALGLVAAERLAGRVLPLVPGAALAGLLAASGVLLAGRIEPLGGLRRFEPDPGWLPDLPLALLGAAGTAGAVLLLGAGAVLLAGSRRPAGHRTAPAPRLPLRAPALVAGTSFALARTSRRVPTRAVLAGAVIGVAGVVATGAFAASLDRLAASPPRWGWTADFGVVDVTEDEVARLVADEQLHAVQVLQEATVDVAGQPTTVLASTPRKGSLPAALVAGRLPATGDEVAVGTRTARRAGVGVDDRLVVAGRELRVSGVLVPVPVASGKALGEGAVVLPELVPALTDVPPLVSALVTAAPGAAGPVQARYAAELEVLPREVPAEVATLVDLGRLPHVLQAFLAAVSAAVLAHGLLQTARLRGPDLAVLRALGLTPRQVGAVLLVAAGTTAGVGLLLGVPLGLAAGRLAWGAAATSIGVTPDLAPPVLLLLLLVPAAAALSALVALVPARRAARLSPAPLLRAE